MRRRSKGSALEVQKQGRRAYRESVTPLASTISRSIAFFLASSALLLKTSKSNRDSSTQPLFHASLGQRQKPTQMTAYTIRRKKLTLYTQDEMENAMASKPHKGNA
jgi:hypothetical protein